MGAAHSERGSRAVVAFVATGRGRVRAHRQSRRCASKGPVRHDDRICIARCFASKQSQYLGCIPAWMSELEAVAAFPGQQLEEGRQAGRHQP